MLTTYYVVWISFVCVNTVIISDCTCVCISCLFFWWYFLHNYLMPWCDCPSITNGGSCYKSTSYWGRTPGGALALQYPHKYDTISWQIWFNILTDMIQYPHRYDTISWQIWFNILTNMLQLEVLECSTFKRSIRASLHFPFADWSHNDTEWG